MKLKQANKRGFLTVRRIQTVYYPHTSEFAALWLVRQKKKNPTKLRKGGGAMDVEPERAVRLAACGFGAPAPRRPRVGVRLTAVVAARARSGARRGCHSNWAERERNDRRIGFSSFCFAESRGWHSFQPRCGAAVCLAVWSWSPSEAQVPCAALLCDTRAARV